jgi:hypothetical protein
VAVIQMSNRFPSLVRRPAPNDLMVSPLRNLAAISLISSAAIFRDQGCKIHLQGLGFAVAVHGLSPFVPGRNLSLEIQYHDRRRWRLPKQPPAVWRDPAFFTSWMLIKVITTPSITFSIVR